MKSLKLAGFFALSVLSSVATTTIARAGDVVWWAPNWGEERARTLAQKFMAANPGHQHQGRGDGLERPARARAHRPAVRRGARTSSKSSTAG